MGSCKGNLGVFLRPVYCNGSRDLSKEKSRVRRGPCFSEGSTQYMLGSGHACSSRGASPVGLSCAHSGVEPPDVCAGHSRRLLLALPLLLLLLLVLLLLLLLGPVLVVDGFIDKRKSQVWWWTKKKKKKKKPRGGGEKKKKKKKKK